VKNQRFSPRPTDETKLDQARTRIGALDQEQQRLLNFAVKGLCTEEQLANESQRIRRERASWEHVLRDSQQQALPKVNDIATCIATTFAEFMFLPLSARKQLLRQVVESIRIDQGAIMNITVRVPNTNLRNPARAVLRTTSGGSATAHRRKFKGTCRVYSNAQNGPAPDSQTLRPKSGM
jgi:hypothetical protein